jgi:hypothetical protein
MGPKLIVMVLALALVPLACFPGEDHLSSVSFELSLADLGMTGERKAVHNWLDWLGNGDPSLAYDLEGNGQSFFMDLSLTGTATSSQLGFLGDSISLEDSVLTAQLQVSDCRDCRFNAVIFWVEDVATQQVSTFTGESEEFSVTDQTPTQDIVNMNVWLEYTGSIRCTATNAVQDGQAVTLAALDVEAMVIFPSVTGMATDKEVTVVLPDIPLGREMNVLYRPPTGGAYSNSPVATGVKIGIEGQTVDVGFDIP